MLIFSRKAEIKLADCGGEKNFPVFSVLNAEILRTIRLSKTKMLRF